MYQYLLLMKMKTEIWSRNTCTQAQISSKDKCVFHSSRIIWLPDKFVAAKVHYALLRLAEKPAVKFLKPAVYQKNTDQTVCIHVAKKYELVQGCDRQWQSICEAPCDTFSSQMTLCGFFGHPPRPKGHCSDCMKVLTIPAWTKLQISWHLWLASKTNMLLCCCIILITSSADSVLVVSCNCTVSFQPISYLSNLILMFIIHTNPQSTDCRFCKWYHQWITIHIHHQRIM